MRNFILCTLVLFTSYFSFAQPPLYDDLKVLYADGNYEKLAKVGSGYTENEKTSKEILPYIWLGKGLYKMSLVGTEDPKYANAYKDAIMYVKKGLSYDIKYNEGATFEEHREFLDEFQGSVLETIENDLSTGNFKKTYGWVIKYKTITLNTVGAEYLMGACKYYDADKATARTSWKEADLKLAKITGVDTWSEADRKMLKLGILYSAKALKEGRQIEQSRALVNKVAQWFEADEDWQSMYDEIVN